MTQRGQIEKAAAGLRTINVVPRLPAPPCRKKLAALGVVVLALLAFVPFLPTIQNDFLPTWDDGVYVLQNYRIQQVSAANVLDLFRLHPQQGRMPNGEFTPLVELSFMIEHHLFGLAPGIFHLTNVLLHVLNTLLVFLFVRRLTAKTLWAWLTALFFSVHPLHVESVAWVTERKDMLSALFFLGAMLLYLRYRDNGSRRAYGLVILMGICSFFSKPLAVTLPAVLLLVDYYREGAIHRRHIIPMLPLFVLSAVGVFVTFYTHIPSQNVELDEVQAIGSNLLIAARGIALYVEKFIWPIGLSAFYPSPETWQSVSLDYYAALAALVAVVGLLAYFFRQGRQRLLVFCGLLFLVLLSPSSRVIPCGMRILAADRFFYLPGIGFFMLLGYGIHRLLHARPAWRWSAISLTAGLCLFWGATTWQRSQIWRNDVTLWQDAVAKHPESSIVVGSMAQAWAAVDPETAGRYADRALAISDQDGHPMLIKAFLHQRAGQYQACFEWLAKAQGKGINPAYIAIMAGRTYSLQGEYQKAVEAFASGMVYEPQASDYLGWMAISWLALDNEAAALECLQKMEQVNGRLARQARLLEQYAPQYASLSPLKRAMCLNPGLMRYQYEVAQNSQFLLKDEPRAMREYRLLLAYYPAVVNVWQAVAKQIPRHRWPPQVMDIQTAHVRKLGISFYNYACLLAMDGDTGGSMEALQQAFRYDGSLRDSAATDPDLSSLTGYPEFVAMMSPSSSLAASGRAAHAKLDKAVGTL